MAEPPTYDWPLIIAWAEAQQASGPQVEARFGCPASSFRRVRSAHDRKKRAAERSENPSKSKKKARGERIAASQAKPPAEGPSLQSMRAEDLTSQDRERLRVAVRIDLERLANPDTGAWERQAAATTLRILLTACPDLLTFDERTRSGREADMAGAGPTTGEDVEVRLHGVLGAGGPEDEG